MDIEFIVVISLMLIVIGILYLKYKEIDREIIRNKKVLELIKREIKRKILKTISCGKPFSNWVCGDFLEQEVDEEGRSLGKCYFCDKCHKKADEIMDFLKGIENERKNKKRN